MGRAGRLVLKDEGTMAAFFGSVTENLELRLNLNYIQILLSYRTKSKRQA